MSRNVYSVPYVALGQQTAVIKHELMSAFESVLDSGQYILGYEVLDFEREFASYCQTKFAVGIASGTCGLHLVLKGLGLTETDEVITAPNSFIASASSIALTGARPVFVDILPDLNIDPQKIEQAITPHTRAIMPVHLTGRPARMVEIMEIAKHHNLLVIEDAAQAVGAKLNNQRVGSWGDAAIFSLHPLKNLHAFGDGGMMTTNRSDFFDQLRKARNHGLQNRDSCEFWSFNCRLDEVQAALLRVQLRYLEKWTEERRQIAFRYNKLLSPYVTVPIEAEGEYCVYQTYVIQTEYRDALQSYLDERGVQTLVHYPTPIHLQPAARELGYSVNSFPGVMQAAERILSLPLYPGLTAAQQDQVIDLIVEFYQRHT